MVLRVVTFKLDEETLEKLDTVARLAGQSRSELIRQGIEYIIKVYKSKYQPRPKYVRIG